MRGKREGKDTAGRTGLQKSERKEGSGYGRGGDAGDDEKG